MRTIVLTLLTIAACDAGSPLCRPAPEVANELATSGATSVETPYMAYREQSLAQLDAILSKHPGDVFVLEKIQDVLRMPTIQEREEAIRRYQALASEHPKSAVYRYLLARLLVGQDTPRAIQLLNDASQLDTAFPRPLLELARIYRSPIFRNENLAAAALERYAQICPARDPEPARVPALKQPPPSPTPKELAIARAKAWSEAHPMPSNADPDTIRAHQAMVFQQTAQWMREVPDEPLPFTDHLKLARILGDAGRTDIESTGQALLRIHDRLYAWFAPSPPLCIEVAQAWAQYGVFLERIPDLVQRGFREIETLIHGQPSDLDSAERAGRARLQIMRTYWAGWQALAETYKKTGTPDKARSILRQYRASLDEYDPALVQAAEQEYNRLALLLGDATGVARSASRRGWPHVDLALPAFDLTDLDGRSWRAADLAGTTTLINVWATWCGPCRLELPAIEKLFRGLQGRKDVAVITLNLDEDAAIARVFMREHGYTFPVIVSAREYVAGLLPGWTIPCNWVVDRSGKRVAERVGFGGDGEIFAREALQALDDAQRQVHK